MVLMICLELLRDEGGFPKAYARLEDLTKKDEGILLKELRKVPCYFFSSQKQLVLRYTDGAQTPLFIDITHTMPNFPTLFPFSCFRTTSKHY